MLSIRMRRFLAAALVGLIPFSGIGATLITAQNAGADSVPQPTATLQGTPACNIYTYTNQGDQQVVYNLFTNDVQEGYTAQVTVSQRVPAGSYVNYPSVTLTADQSWNYTQYTISNSVRAASLTLHIVWSGSGLPTVTKDLTAGVYNLPGNCPADPRVHGAIYVGMAAANGGYWLARADGRVAAWGNVAWYGDMYNANLNAPIVGMASTADGKGYWLLGGDGGIFSFGDAAFYGSTGNIRLNQPVVGMVATKSGHGYWLVAKDGGIFAFGDAAFYGSMGGKLLNQPVVGMTSTAGGHGYYLVAADGGIFCFGDATFKGSMGGTHLNQPVVGMAAAPNGGYWMVAVDGGIFSFGNAAFYGSTGGSRYPLTITGMAATPDGQGYWFVSYDGGLYNFGDAGYFGNGVGL